MKQFSNVMYSVAQVYSGFIYFLSYLMAEEKNADMRKLDNKNHIRELNSHNGESENTRQSCELW